MWTAAPQRGLHSAGICFRHTDIRETFTDGGSLVPLFYSNVGPATFLRFRILSYAIFPFLCIWAPYLWIKNSFLYIRGKYLILRAKEKEEDKMYNITVKRHRLCSSSNEISKINLLRCYGRQLPIKITSYFGCKTISEIKILRNFFSLQYE